MDQAEVLNHYVLSLQKDVQGLPQWSQMRQVIQANKSYTFVGRHRHKQGAEVAVAVVTTSFKWQQQDYFLSVARNVNNRLAWAWLFILSTGIAVILF